jgi:hypothetical protein
MASQDDLEDVPDWARGLLRQAEHNEIVRIFNEATLALPIFVLANRLRRAKLEKRTG